jgi:hypothetical protein
MIFDEMEQELSMDSVFNFWDKFDFDVNQDTTPLFNPSAPKSPLLNVVPSVLNLPPVSPNLSSSVPTDLFCDDTLRNSTPISPISPGLPPKASAESPTGKRKRQMDEVETRERKRVKMVGKKIKFYCDECETLCKEIKNVAMLQKLYPEYGKGFYCDECNLGSPTWPMFHCTQPKCEYDVCMNCALKDCNQVDVATVEVEASGARDDVRLNLLDDDESLAPNANSAKPPKKQVRPLVKIEKDPVLKQTFVPKRKPKRKSEFKLIFARPGVNPVGVLPRFEVKKQGRTRSFDIMKRNLNSRGSTGRGKGMKPIVKKDSKAGFSPPKKGKYAIMEAYKNDFFWKTGDEWIAYWPCFEAEFDQIQFAR